MKYPAVLLGVCVLLASCADDAPPDGRSTTTTEATAPSSSPTSTSSSTTTEAAIERADLLADTDAWAAGWFDGEPILDGPWISSRARDVLTIEGCVLGSEFPMSISAEGVVVDETRPLVEYDCSEPRIEPGIRAQLVEFVFDDPDHVRLDDHRLELVDGDHTLTFSPVRDIARLDGDWRIRSIDEVDTTSALTLRFRPAAAEFSVGVVELRLCDQLLATARYSTTTVGGTSQGGFDAFCADPDDADNGQIDAVERLLDEPAELRWIGGTAFELFDGATVVRVTAVTG